MATKDVKEAKTKIQPTLEPEPMPTMIRLTEFLNSEPIRKAHKVETLGGFLNWVKNRSAAKLPFDGWNKLLEQFSSRIVR